MKNTFKKSILFLILAITTFSIFSFNHPTFANTSNQKRINGTNCDLFLGLTPWDCGVLQEEENLSGEEKLKAGIWQIAANVASDITVIAAYLVLGYVIYGGYLYTFSGGDPGKIANGRKTLAQAFLGLAIVMSANIIMGAIRIALVGSSGNIGNCVTEGGCIKPNEMVTSLINWFIAIAGIVSAIFLVYGGITYITSSGDPGKVKKAKDMIMYSLIGLAIVALATVITSFVSSNINKATDTSFSKTIISKEDHETKSS